MEVQADLRELFEQAPIGLYRTTPEGRVVMANPAFANMLGYASVAALLASAIHRDASGELNGCESDIRRVDGRAIVIREHSRAVRDRNGQVAYYAGSAEDITGLHNARCRLERFGNEYQILFDANPHPMWIFDSETLRFLAVNDAAVARYGYSRDELLAKTVLDIRPEFEINRVINDLRSLDSRLSTSGPWVHRLGDGRTIEVMVTSHALTFGGRPARFVLARDVTQQLLAERALESREAYYRALIENAMDIITVVDGDGRILFESPSLYRVLGYLPCEAVGKNVLSSVHPGDRAAVLNLLASTLEGELPTATFELRMRAADGGWRVLEACARNLLHDPDIGGVVINSRDITARRAALEELRSSEERLRLAQQAGGIGTWEYDFATGLSAGSGENSKLYGEVGLCGPITVEQWLERIHPADRARVAAHYRQCLARRTNFEDEYRVIWPDGTEHWLNRKAEVIANADGNPARVVGVNIDITARKQIEEELAKARDEAIEASRMKSQFLATVSHEIRTPMNAILGLAGLLVDTPMSIEQRADLETIRSSAMHLLDLINDILDLAKAESGKIACERVPFDLRGTLASVVELVETSASGKGLSLRLDYPGGIRWRVSGDAGRLRQIVLNFVSNAIKFTNLGSVTITVSTPADIPPDMLRISVTDTGEGLPADLQSHLFERFVQGSNNRKHGGTGLGLAISKWLAEAMGGRVGSGNRPCGGAEFWLDLPLPEAPAGSLPVPAVPAARPCASAGRRVLIAEDNPVNQRVMLRLLEKRGVRADIASNGMEAVQMWRDLPYDLILMDCRMPEMDGYEATRHIRAEERNQAHIPIVAVTAHVGEGERQRCLASGMDGYLQKPFQTPELDNVLLQYFGEMGGGASVIPNAPAALQPAYSA